MPPGKRTEVLARFSTVAGERGSPDTWRDPRGFALEFCTEQGNFDLVGRVRRRCRVCGQRASVALARQISSAQLVRSIGCGSAGPSRLERSAGGRESLGPLIFHAPARADSKRAGCGMTASSSPPAAVRPGEYRTSLHRRGRSNLTFQAVPLPSHWISPSQRQRIYAKPGGMSTPTTTVFYHPPTSGPSFARQHRLRCQGLLACRLYTSPTGHLTPKDHVAVANRTHTVWFRDIQ